MKKVTILVTLVALLAFASSGLAAGWTFPNEVPVTGMYNAIYGTNYSTTDDSGLWGPAGTGLLADHGAPMPSTAFSLNSGSAQFLDTFYVLTMDSSSTADIKIRVGNTDYLAFDTPAWPSSGTRGVLNEKIVVSDILSNYGVAATEFFLVVGNTLLSATNTAWIWGLDNNGAQSATDFMLASNFSTLSGSDHDANEPLLSTRAAPTPIPGAIWLLGSGLVGLVGLRRKMA